MSATNSFELVGRVVREPQVFPRNNGAKSVLFTVAVNSGRKDQNGQDIADFVEVSGYVATNNGTKVYDYVHAKDLLGVQGHLHSYKDKNNHTQIAFQIDNIEFLSKYKGNDDQNQPQAGQENTVDTTVDPNMVDMPDPSEYTTEMPL